MQEAADCLGADCVPRYVEMKQMGDLDVGDILRQLNKARIIKTIYGCFNLSTSLQDLFLSSVCYFLTKI